MNGSDNGSTRRPLALVVDDFADGREITRTVLDKLGFCTLEAADGHDALARTRERLPDLIILDLALPGIDGWEVARRLKSDPTTAAIPILAYTAHAERSRLARAEAVGCEAVLTKPCLPSELADGVRRLMPELSRPTWRRDLV